RRSRGTPRRRSGRAFRQSVRRGCAGDPQELRKTGQTAWRLLSSGRRSLAWSIRPARGYYTTRVEKYVEGRDKVLATTGVRGLPASLLAQPHQVARCSARAAFLP